MRIVKQNAYRSPLRWPLRLLAFSVPLVLGSAIGERRLSEWRLLEAERDLEEIKTCLIDFAKHEGRYPHDLESLAAWLEAERPTGSTSISLEDPWGEPFIYSPDGYLQGAALGSRGPDRRQGGIGTNSDIYPPGWGPPSPSSCIRMGGLYFWEWW